MHPRRLAFAVEEDRDVLRREAERGGHVLARALLDHPIRIEALVAALVAEGFRAGDALGGVLTVIHYTLGATLEEQSDPRNGDPTVPAESLPPILAALAETPGTSDSSRVDARFELGVQRIVEGLRTRWRARRKGR